MNPTDLHKPFSPEKISWRVGPTSGDKKSGIALAYIDARDVQDRLDDVCGVGGWQCRYPHANGKTVCEIGVKIGDEWIWKADGAGDTDMEAEKGALSDAFKRAAVRWGIGRYLYDVKNTWVEIEKVGNSYKIAEKEYARLRKTLGGNDTPRPASETQSNVAPVNRASEWCLKAEKEVLAIRDRAAMAEWSRKNAPAIDKLRTTDMALYNAINLKIALRNDELELVPA